MNKTEEIETTETADPTVELEAELEELVEIDRPTENPAVLRCIRAFNRANRKCREKNPEATPHEADIWGTNSYLRAMPPLVGINNIRDYIACVTFALVTDIISPDRAEMYLSAARVALGAIRCA